MRLTIDATIARSMAIPRQTRQSAVSAHRFLHMDFVHFCI
jgi:hypothetical protein